MRIGQKVHVGPEGLTVVYAWCCLGWTHLARHLPQPQALQPLGAR